MSGARKVHIRSFGCQMNVYDSHRMADTLAGEGYAETSTAGDADLIAKRRQFRIPVERFLQKALECHRRSFNASRLFVLMRGVADLRPKIAGHNC